MKFNIGEGKAISLSRRYVAKDGLIDVDNEEDITALEKIYKPKKEEKKEDGKVSTKARSS